MGYRGKIAERQRARELRAQARTLEEIASELGVSKSSVSLWVRDVIFDPQAQDRPARARRRAPNALARRKQAEIEAERVLAFEQIGPLTPRDLLIAGTALYAGEGAKSDGAVIFANTNPEIMRLFCAWLRTTFVIDESRLRVRLYLHEGLDLDAAIEHWSLVTDVPSGQFSRPYRARADAGIRTSKHPFGCASVRYNCARTHRRVMGLIDAMLDAGAARGADSGYPWPRIPG